MNDQACISFSNLWGPLMEWQTPHPVSFRSDGLLCKTLRERQYIKLTHTASPRSDASTQQITTVPASLTWIWCLHPCLWVQGNFPKALSFKRNIWLTTDDKRKRLKVPLTKVFSSFFYLFSLYCNDKSEPFNKGGRNIIIWGRRAEGNKLCSPFFWVSARSLLFTVVQKFD